MRKREAEIFEIHGIIYSMINDHSHERGNVLFIIFIGIALFGALSFAVSNMMRGGSGTGNIVSEEKAALYAGEILDYARGVRQTVRELQISNGCSDTEISFQHDEDNDGDFNDTGENYSNPNAPTDHSCHVFHPDGGGLRWSNLPIEIYDTEFADTSASYGQVFYTAFFEILNVGDDCGEDSCVELSFIIPDIKPNICDAINSKVGIDSISADGITNYSPVAYAPLEFVGEYRFVNSGSVLGNNSTNIAGKMSGCWYVNANTMHSFYQVLIAR